jgi:polysaccharide pyruvyl transferase WcaK-like protein
VKQRSAQLPVARSSEAERPSEPPTITFFGNFGAGNLGNELTLRAIVQNTRKHLPAARLNCICAGPAVAARTHGIPAMPISYRFGRAAAPTTSRRDHPAVRLLRRIVVRVPRELAEWVRAFQALRGTTLLVMTGTGMLGDFGIGPLDLHYEILKWSILAKLRRCKLLFVSVGAGPIRSGLSRRIVKAALSLADYRSYRDEFSLRFLRGIGFDTSRDSVRPDLAFSLDDAALRVSKDGRADDPAGPVVGLGLMEYIGNRERPADGERIYRRYVDRVSSFAAWLLERGYSIRLLVGDVAFDRRVRGDLLRSLDGQDLARVIDVPLAELEDLPAQLARTDIVVATRFHNVLLGLMLGKPVVALSYHEKVHSLMAGVGAEDYCVDAKDLDVPRLMERFASLEKDVDRFRLAMTAKAEEYRRALDEQYALMFAGLRATAPWPLRPQTEPLAASPSAIGGPLV